jgi:hypothetical protein
LESPFQDLKRGLVIKAEQKLVEWSGSGEMAMWQTSATWGRSDGQVAKAVFANATPIWILGKKNRQTRRNEMNQNSLADVIVEEQLDSGEKRVVMVMMVMEDGQGDKRWYILNEAGRRIGGEWKEEERMEGEGRYLNKWRRWGRRKRLGRESWNEFCGKCWGWALVRIWGKWVKERSEER